jgi:hypothetical protein
MLKRVLQGVWCAGLCLVLMAQPGFGQGNGNGKNKNKHDADSDDYDRDSGRARVTIVFSARDRDIIRDYYSHGNSNLPPGLAKRNGNLPPGLQKHLERNGTLPPGLQKRLTPFPDDLERRLPRLPTIYTRGSIGADIVILDRRTQKIVDIVHDILTL